MSNEGPDFLVNRITSTSLPDFRKKEIAILAIASTLNPIPIMDLSKKLAEMAKEIDSELYDGSQFSE